MTGEPRDAPRRQAEERDRRHARDERREQLARPRSLDGEDAVLVADLLDGDLVAAADEVLEIGEVRFRGGQQELVGGRSQDDAVLDHEAAVVAPGRVLRVPGGAAPDVAGEDPDRNFSASRPWIRYL